MIRQGRKSYIRGQTISLSVPMGKGVSYKAVVYCGLIDKDKQSPKKEVNIKATMGEFEYPNVITIYPKTKITNLDQAANDALEYFCGKFTNGVYVTNEKGTTCSSVANARLLADDEIVPQNDEDNAEVDDDTTKDVISGETTGAGKQSFRIYVLGDRFSPENGKIYERIYDEFNNNKATILAELGEKVAALKDSQIGILTTGTANTAEWASTS